MEDDNDIKGFLKAYANLLKGVELSDIKSEIFPLKTLVRMPSGGITIFTNKGDAIAFVSIDEGMGPSMPIGPAAMVFAHTFIDLTNAYYNYLKGKI